MAAQLVTRINRYIGTAAEIAAMTLTDIPTGSTFFESDTGILKILNAAGALVEAPSESVQLSGSNAQESEAVTVDNTAGGVALTPAKYAGCRSAFITVEDAQLRWTIDGTAPTTTVGHVANPADIIDLVSAEDMAAFRAIRTGSTSAKLYCTYSV